MTPNQRMMLMSYQSFRRSPPTVPGLIVRFLPVWLLLFIVCGAIVVLGVVRNLHVGTGLGVGLFVGIVARDIGFAIRTASGWPVVNAIINWELVEKLLSHDVTPSQQSRP